MDPTSLSGLIQLIVGRLETLNGSAQLDHGQFDSLVAHLESALAALAMSQSDAARNSLEVFINRVDVFEDQGVLSAADAEALRSAADDVIDQL